MKITRNRLKQIILEEMATYDDSHGDPDDNMSSIGESEEEVDSIAESAGWEIAQQLANVLIDTGVVGGDAQALTPALMGLTKFGINMLAATVAGTAAVKAFEAFKELRKPAPTKPSEPEDEVWISGPGLEDREPEVYQEQEEDAAEKSSQADSVTGNPTLDELINQAVRDELNLLRGKKV